jgi:hypothetical protein
MKRTNDEIEEPVKKSPLVLVFGILILIFMIGLGIFLLVEALQEPDGPQDVLDMRRMLASGVGVILFSVAILFFLISLYKSSAQKKTAKPAAKKKPAPRKSNKKR